MIALDAKVARALVEIERALSGAALPVVGWTGGRDSQVLLDLARRVRADVPLWWLRQDHASKSAHAWHYAYLARIGAEVYDGFPVAWTWLSDGRDVDLVAVFHSSGHLLPFVFEVEQRDDGECVFEVTSRVDARQVFFPFDLLLSGQRDGDVDGWGNTVRLPGESTQVGATRVAWPLRDWSDEDVGAYVVEQRVPLPPTPQAGQTVRSCVRCLTANGRDVVCPKSGQILQTQTFDYAAQQEDWRRLMGISYEQNA